MDDLPIEDLFASVGPVSIRRMFGGKGVYVGGRIIAVVLRDTLYLKTDDTTGPEFVAAGATRWTYARDRQSAVAMPYHTLPDEALDDPDAMERWAALAVEAASRAAIKPARKRSISLKT